MKYISILILLVGTLRGYAGNDKDGVSVEEFFQQADSVRCYTGLLNVYETQGRYYWLIADSLLNRDFLVTTTILKGAAREKRYPEQRYGYAGDRLDAQMFSIVRKGGKLLLMQPFVQDWVADTLCELADIVRQRGNGAVVKELEIKAENAKGVLVEISGLLEDHDSFFGLGKFEVELGIGTYLPQSSYLKEIKTFPNSLVVRFVRGYMSVNYLPDPSLKPEPTRWEYGVSLCLLPKIPMRGRRSDARVGYFTSTVRDYRDAAFGVGNMELISRWRLEPQVGQEEACRRGEVVEPRKPIVYYIDRQMPDWLIPYIRQAVEAWQPAFEQAGFKNAIQARLEPLPEEKTDFSVDHALYAYISYKTSPIANAYGPSSVDPRSGEILCSHIGVYNSIAELVQGLYFCQAGVVDSVARRIVLPDTLLGKLIQYVVCHEVGHALGLKHNFRGSSVFTLKQIRDREFVRQNGYGASIMDYMRFNYAAQPEDSIALDDIIPRVGAYDRFAIEWGYRYFPHQSVAEEQEYLRQWLDEREREPLYRYNGTNDTDILSQSEDLGNDQMQTNALGIKNMQYLMALDCWETESDEQARRVMGYRYRTMIVKFQGYVEQVLMNIRGVTEEIDSLRGNRRMFVPVSKQRQLEALRFLDRYVCTPPEWLFQPDLFRHYRIDERMNMDAMFVQVVYGLLGKLKSPAAPDYPQEEFLTDLRYIIFKEWETGEPVSEARKRLQRMYIDRLKWMATTSYEKDCRITLWIVGELEEIEKLARHYMAYTPDKLYPRSVITGIHNWKIEEQ